MPIAKAVAAKHSPSCVKRYITRLAAESSDHRPQTDNILTGINLDLSAGHRSYSADWNDHLSRTAVVEARIVKTERTRSRIRIPIAGLNINTSARAAAHKASAQKDFMPRFQINRSIRHFDRSAPIQSRTAIQVNSACTRLNAQIGAIEVYSRGPSHRPASGADNLRVVAKDQVPARFHP